MFTMAVVTESSAAGDGVTTKGRDMVIVGRSPCTRPWSGNVCASAQLVIASSLQTASLECTSVVGGHRVCYTRELACVVKLAKSQLKFCMHDLHISAMRAPFRLKTMRARA